MNFQTKEQTIRHHVIAVRDQFAACPSVGSGVIRDAVSRSMGINATEYEVQQVGASVAAYLRGRGTIVRVAPVDSYML